jgi:hypothetical protein
VLEGKVCAAGPLSPYRRLAQSPEIIRGPMEYPRLNELRQYCAELKTSEGLRTCYSWKAINSSQPADARKWFRVTLEGGRGVVLDS